MKPYDFSAEYQNLCVCGDIHGEFPTLAYNLKRFGIENSVVIVAGDCGIGFEKENHYSALYNKLRKSLEKSNNLIILVRGNHDDPAYFDGERIDFERMKCVPDYSVIKVGGRTVLCVGGAISVDRDYRKQAMELDRIKRRYIRPLYWENEPAVFNEKSLDEIGTMSIDTVVTHTCPSFCYPVAKSGIACYLSNDESLADELHTERAMMDKLHERLISDNHPIQSWYYGHFHESHTEFIDNIKFCLLGINEIKEG